MKKALYTLIASTILCSTSCGAQTYNNETTEVISCPQVPKSIKFADTDISFDRVDMHERMDRELISLMYSHSSTILTIKRANRYRNEILPILKKNGVPTDFFYLVATESTFDERAYSPAKAAGLWQFLASTAKQYGLEVNEYVDERYNTTKVTEAACRFLKTGFKKYGDWMTVASSYNAGMGRISSELEKQGVDNAYDLYLNKETSRYIFRMVAYKLVIEHPEKYGFNIPKSQLYYPISYKEVKVDTPITDWVAWAKKQGITYAQLREANQWIKATSLPNKTRKTYIVRIPNKEDLYLSTQKH